MKINIEQTDALLRQQESAAARSRGQTGASNAFDALLTEQLGGMDGTTADMIPPGIKQAEMISEILLAGTDKSDAVSADQDVFQEVMTQTSGTLDMWENYIGALKTPGNSLRNAYAMLEGIDDQVTGLKGSTAAVRGQNPAIDSLVNELEIMAATEKFKFNRGDYSV